MAFYRPLDNPETDIRLLTILPSDEVEADLQLKIQHTLLAEAPPYEALSYTWSINDTDRWDITYTVYVNDTKFEILENLYDALKALRRANAPRVIWNDRICINQDDYDKHGEKQKQLGLMRKVYGAAEKVIAWLGQGFGWTLEHYSDSSSPTEAALPTTEPRFHYFDILNVLLKTIIREQTWPSAHHSPVPRSQLPKGGEPPWVDSRSFLEWTSAIDLFMAERYWQRVWVVQELAAAKVIEVQLGENVFEWSDIRQAAETIALHFHACCQNRRGNTDKTTASIDQHLSLFSRTILDIEATRRMFREGTRLEPFLRRHRNKGATEQVDVLNALINLVRDWGAGPQLSVSSKGAKFEDLICEALLSQINAFSSLSILCGDVGIWDIDHNDAIGGAIPQDEVNDILDLQHRQAESQDDKEKRALCLQEYQLIRESNSRAKKNFYARANLPSWAKCFACCGTMDDNGPLYTSPRFDYLHLYKAAGDSKPHVKMQTDRTLLIRGVLVDAIDFLADDTLNDAPGYTLTSLNGKQIDDSPEAVIRDWREVVESLPLPSKAYTTRDELRRALTRILHCDLALPVHPSGPFGKKVMSQIRLQNSEELGDRLQNGWDRAEYNTCALGRKLFVTKRGRIGLGSPAIEEGDRVAVLYGGSVPFILRRCDESPQHVDSEPLRYKLFGDCYCDGLMDGEGMVGQTVTLMLD